MADSNGYSSVFSRQAGTGSAAILKDKPNETLDLLMKRKWQKEDLDKTAKTAAAAAEAKRIADLKQPTMTSNNLRKPFIEQNNANQQYGQDVLLENITKGTDANKDPRFFQYQAEKNRLEQENKQYETATQPFNDGQGLGMRDENGNYYEYTSLNELENTGGYSPKNEYYKRQNSDTFGKTISDRPQAAVNDGTSSISAPMYGNFGKDMVAQTQNNQEFARYLQDGLGVNVQSFEKDQQFLKLDKGKSLSSGGTAHTQTPTYSIDKEALTKNVGERLLGDMNGISELSKNPTFAPMVNNYYKYKEEGDKVNADKELKKIYNTQTFTDYANTAVDMEMQRIGKTQKAMNELASYSFSKQNVATGFDPNQANKAKLDELAIEKGKREAAGEVVGNVAYNVPNSNTAVIEGKPVTAKSILYSVRSVTTKPNEAKNFTGNSVYDVNGNKKDSNQSFRGVNMTQGTQMVVKSKSGQYIVVPEADMNRLLFGQKIKIGGKEYTQSDVRVTAVATGNDSKTSTETINPINGTTVTTSDKGDSFNAYGGTVYSNMSFKSAVELAPNETTNPKQHKMYLDDMIPYYAPYYTGLSESEKMEFIQDLKNGQ